MAWITSDYDEKMGRNDKSSWLPVFLLWTSLLYIKIRNWWFWSLRVAEFWLGMKKEICYNMFSPNFGHRYPLQRNSRQIRGGSGACLGQQGIQNSKTPQKLTYLSNNIMISGTKLFPQNCYYLTYSFSNKLTKKQKKLKIKILNNFTSFYFFIAFCFICLGEGRLQNRSVCRIIGMVAESKFGVLLRMGNLKKKFGVTKTSA